MSTLYIRLPSKAAADANEHWLALPCPFALTTAADAIEREGIAPLSELAGAVASVHRVVLILAASDVTLLRVKTPPLPISRLKLVLPNLVEDQLMTDPSECVVVPGNLADGLRTAGVVQRGWLDILSKSFTSYGARSLVAIPAQLCLPYREDGVTAAIAEQGADIDLALRITEQDGIGLPIMPESADTQELEVLQALRAIVPAQAITLYVPQALVPRYQQLSDTEHAADEQANRPGINVFADSWAHWIAGAGKSSLNLMSGLGAGSGPQVNWRQWRWAIGLAASILLINALALNIDWWRMKREAASLRSAMIQTFKSAYPKETVILDPVAQMHKKIDAAQRNAGAAAPDDFNQLAGNFAEALASEALGGAAGVISAIEYRDRSLLAHLKPDSKISMEKVKVALAARNLALSSPSNGVWQIRSAK